MGKLYVFHAFDFESTCLKYYTLQIFKGFHHIDCGDFPDNNARMAHVKKGIHKLARFQITLALIVKILRALSLLCD